MRQPTFIVPGVAKSGTSVIHHHLSSHPEIFLPKIKETWFYALKDNPNQAIRKYVYHKKPKSINDYAMLYRNASATQKLGEICPSYLYYSENTIKNIHKYHPDPKGISIIIVIRNPLNKVISHYRFVRNKGLDPDNLTIQEAIDQESNRINSPNLLPDLFLINNTLVSKNIKDYLANFDKILFLTYDQLRHEPGILFNNICSFIDVDPTFFDRTNFDRQVNKSNEYTSPKFPYSIKTQNKISNTLRKISPSVHYRYCKLMNNKETIPTKTINQLKELFLPEVEELENLTQLDLSEWKASLD